MSFVTNILIPIIQMIAYTVLAGWVLYIIYWILKKIFGNLGLLLKYKILRRPFKEKDVQWCMNASEKKMNDIAIKKFLLIKGTSQKRINEILYIFNKVNRELKGGEGNGKQFEKNDGETKEIPQI